MAVFFFGGDGDITQGAVLHAILYAVLDLDSPTYHFWYTLVSMSFKNIEK